LYSVRQQVWPKVEHIIIDGGSTDGSLEILKRWDGLIRFVSEPDKGIYDAMNKGLALATGDVIGILNADDLYSDSYVLSRVASKFEDPDLDSVFGDLEYFRSNAPTRVVRTYRSKGFSIKKLSQGIIPAHPTLFLKKSVYEKFGLFDPTYKIAGDFEFMARIFKNGDLNFRYSPEVMVRMQMGGESTKGLRRTLILLRENLRACRQNGIDTNYLRLISRLPKKLLEYFFHEFH
jgi:glycosyltransferase involved in cell wall biosynthesis